MPETASPTFEISVIVFAFVADDADVEAYDQATRSAIVTPMMTTIVPAAEGISPVHPAMAAAIAGATLAPAMIARPQVGLGDTSARHQETSLPTRRARSVPSRRRRFVRLRHIAAL
jgi:hypothetical protein